MKLFLLMSILLSSCSRIGFAEVNCKNRELSPELQKACYESVKVCKEIGCTVKLR